LNLVHTRANEVAARAIAEVVEDAIAMSLKHLRMGVETGESKLGDFLGEKFDSVGGIAENNRLINL